MSKWAIKRKRKIFLLIGIVIFIILGMIFIKINNKPPTCIDGVQNGHEAGVDCGGACSQICEEEVRNIVVWWERPFKVAHGVYNTVAYFENQNLESGLQKIDYEFRLYDENNIIVSQPIYGSTFIEPKKRSAVFESGITTGDSEAYTAFFHISSVQDWQRTDQSFAYSLFNIGEPVLTNQETSPKLSAPIENKTYYNFVDVPVIVILYNREDNAIAASRTYLDSIAQGATETVFFSWPEPFGDIVSRIEIIPRIDPFTDRELERS